MLESAGRSEVSALNVRLPQLAQADAKPRESDAVAAESLSSAAMPQEPGPELSAGSARAPGNILMPPGIVPSSESTASDAVLPDPQAQETARKAAEEAARQALEAKMLPYRAGGLDPGPVPLADIDPVYPEAAGKRQGIVRLTLLINEEGIVDEAIVVYSRPAAMFDDAAVTAFSQARFTPGKFLGIPVKSRLTVEVEFTPINRGGAVTGRGY